MGKKTKLGKNTGLVYEASSSSPSSPCAKTRSPKNKINGIFWNGLVIGMTPEFCHSRSSLCSSGQIKKETNLPHTQMQNSLELPWISEIWIGKITRRTSLNIISHHGEDPTSGSRIWGVTHCWKLGGHTPGDGNSCFPWNPLSVPAESQATPILLLLTFNDENFCIFFKWTAIFWNS